MDKVVKGKITKITSFGAFVQLEDGKSGMIHISEISRNFVKDIHDFVKEGQEVEAAVISNEGERISLSLKRIEKQAPKQSFAVPPDDFYSNASADDGSFEAMMSRFKMISNDKIGDLNKSLDGKKGKNSKNRLK